MIFRRSVSIAVMVGASISVVSCSALGNSDSPAKAYWDGQTQEAKDFACQVGAETAAGVEWEPSMNFTLNDLEKVIAESC